MIWKGFRPLLFNGNEQSRFTSRKGHPQPRYFAIRAAGALVPLERGLARAVPGGIKTADPHYCANDNYTLSKVSTSDNLREYKSGYREYSQYLV